MSLEKITPSSGSVCPPPVQRKIYMAHCPQCGNGPFVREIGGPAVCSIHCEGQFNIRVVKRETRPSRRMRQRQRKQEKLARRAAILNEAGQIAKGMVKQLKAKKKLKWKDLNWEQRRWGVNFYTSQEWLEVRYQALSKSDKRCETCGRGKKDGVKLHVDHIKPRSKFPKLELDLSNLQVLCEDCNLGKRDQLC